MSNLTLSSGPGMKLILSKMSLESSEANPCSLAQGWAKLPDELRLTVLIQVFAHDQIIDLAEYNKLLETLYLPLLLTPYAGIATEALFAHNVFRIQLASKRYPPPAHNTWIRRMDIDMTVDEATANWPFLGKLCTGALGFERLREIDMTWITHRKKSDVRDPRPSPTADMSFTGRGLTPIVSNVKKLTITRKLLFEDNVKCSVWYGRIPVQPVRRPQLWDQVRLKGWSTVTFPVPLGFIGVDGQLYDYRQLPFGEVVRPPFGLHRKKGVLHGIQQVRTLTRKHTSQKPREQTYRPSKGVA